MQKHLEIEFKTFIDKKTYSNLIEEFNLKEKIFKQTNYYFDTKNFSLLNNKTIIRIREKNNRYKITKKEKTQYGNQESSILVKYNEFTDMLKNGFNAKMINTNEYIYYKCNLTTFRAKTDYKNGVIFFDKSEYSNNIDYEIEYEANNYKEGEKIFADFLKEHNIEQTKVVPKSSRAFNSIKNKN